MTSEIFTEWVKKPEKKMLRKKRKIALNVDNCPAHPKIVGLKAVELVFLPPNSTSKTQPMEQGIILNLKVHYRKPVLLKFIKSINRDETPNISILDALHLLSQAWNCVTSFTVSNCFRQAGFTQPNSAPPAPEEDDDFDIKDSIPLARLREHGLNPDIIQNFTTIDDDLETCAELTDDIIEEIKMKKSADALEDQEENDNTIEPPKPQPSSNETDLACEVLRIHFVSPQNSEVHLYHRNVLIDIVHKDNIFRKSTKQTRITSFMDK